MQRSRSRELARARVLRSTPRATTLLRHAPIAAAIMAAMHAARAQEETATLTEIVVTAEKRTENLQDVPISITAMDTRKLEELNLQHFTDYAQALPTVAFQTFEPGFSNIYMRGIVGDANTNHSGPLPSVGTYLDEQPITTIQGSLDLHIYDIARIEVIPGPQGTLYGASSEAGTLRIITNKPDPSGFKAGYDLQANTMRNGTAGGIAEGFVNLPLSSKAALRLVGWYERDSGYIDNVPGTLTYPGNPGLGFPSFTLNNAAIAKQHYNPTDVYGARAALKVELSDSWTVTPALIAQKSKWEGIFAREIWKAPASGTPITSDVAVKHFYPEGGYDDWVDSALTVEGKIGNFDMTYAGAYLKRTDHTYSDYSDYSLGYDTYASYWPANPTQLIFGKDRYQMYSNELRLTSPKDYPVRFVAGLFQQRQQHSIEQRYVINGLDPAFWIGAGGPHAWPDTWWLTEQVRVNRDSAVFGELNWDVTSNLIATGGFRRFTYKNTLEGFYGFGIGGFSTPGSGTSGEGICFRNTPFHSAPCVDLDKRSDGSGWTPKLNLAYKFDAHRMVYATWSKGFRPGGVNRVGLALPYGADFLKNYEVGWKTTWADNHLRFNGALFYETWDNFQFSFLGPNSVTIVANAAQAQVKGLESELEWVVGNGLTLSASGAYLDAYLSANYCGALDASGNPITSNPCVVPGIPGSYAPLAPEGQQLPTTPKWKGIMTARYAFPLAGMQAHVQGNFTYQTAIWPNLLTAERTVLGQQGAYGIANFSFGVTRNTYALELLVKNAFDRRGSQFRYAECTELTCGPIAVYDSVTQPRLVGLQFSQRFASGH